MFFRTLLLTSLFLLLLGGATNAQRLLAGTVTDEATGEPLSYVTIGLRGDPTRGVMTNEQGKFKLTVTEALASDTLVLSFLGYTTVEQPISQLPEGEVAIELTPSAIALTEVVVLSDRGLRAIVLKCFDNIPSLYGSDKHLLEGYFRRYALTNDTVSVLKEGFLQVQDVAYLGRRRRYEDRNDVKFWLQHYRQSNDERELTFFDGGVKSNFIDRQYVFSNLLFQGQLTFHYLQEEYERLNAYDFTDRGTYLMNGDSIRRIGFALRSEGSSGTVDYHNAGELLVNLTDYAILRITVGQGQPDYALDAIYQKAANGKYYPQRLHHIFQVTYNEGRSTHRINTLFHFTHVHTDPAAARRARSGKRLAFDVNPDAKFMKYEPAFWEANPVLLATPLPEALKRDLSRFEDINAQFKANARRTKE